MLIICPECQLQISDKAFACPHCGYPMQNIKQSPRRKAKRMRLPNGFGQISELKGRNLRKPFRVMVTVGKDDEGKPICKPIKPKAYFATYNEAYEALIEYNKNPYSLDTDITVKELFDLWSEEYMRRNHKSSIGGSYASAWKYCRDLYNLPVRELRTWHLKRCMDTCSREINGQIRTPSDNIKQAMKFLFNMMLDYAVEYELTDRNYARTLSNKSIMDAPEGPLEPGHIAFTEEDLKVLWENINEVPLVDVLLIQCYSGWRPQELGLLRLENIDLENGFIVGGMKTKAGTGRLVPIHSKIRHLVEEKYKEAQELHSPFLFNIEVEGHKKTIQLTYKYYYRHFSEVMESLNLSQDHKPHDGRKTFVTLAKKYKVDEYAIKHMVGHAISDLTESIYTERDPKWLSEEIEKIV